MSWSSSWYVTTLPSLVATSIVVIAMFVCHVIKQDRVIKVLGDYHNRSPSRQVTNLLNLVVIDTAVVEINGFSLLRDLAKLQDQWAE